MSAFPPSSVGTSPSSLTSPEQAYADAAIEAVLADYADVDGRRDRFATPGDLAKALDPATVQTPALDAIDAALVRVANGECKRLIVTMPPQEGKSERITHYTPLWLLQRDHNLRVAVVSFEVETARRWGYAIRSDIIRCDGTDGEIDLGLRLRPDSRAVGQWKLAEPAKGGVYAVGIKGAITGRPVDFMVIDDPVKDYRAADSVVESEQAWLWWLAAARTRLAPGAPVVLVLTRWHENDMAGRLLAQMAKHAEEGREHYDHWEVLNIPAQADHHPERGETDPLGREPGEFLISARGRTQADWEATKAESLGRVWSALYQGRPTPDTGNVLHRDWWKRYQGSPLAVADELTEIIASWDMAFKDTKGSDYVVGQVWGRREKEAFLLDQVRGRWDFTATCAQVGALASRWPQAKTHLVEDKANGPAVISQLRAKLAGLIPVTPTDSKYARAAAVSPFIESGNVHIPAVGGWVEDFVEECAAFPNAAHDDQVDAMSQALHRLLIDGQSVDAWAAFYRRRYGRAEVEHAPLPRDL